MSKKLYLPVILMVLFSMLVAACSPAVATEAPVVATEAPVVATEAPTEVVTEAPAPEFAALFQAVIDGAPADKGYGTVAAAKLNEEIIEKAPFLLDVREAAELEKDGYIEGAVNIPVRDVLNNLDKLPGLDEPIVVYCASGHRGGFVFSALRMLGYTNVRNLASGLGAWKKAELPVVTGSLPDAPKAISQPIVADKPLYDALNAFFTGLPEGFSTVKPADLNGLLVGAEAPVVVDVRTEKEYAETGYIGGAVNLPLQSIMQNLDKLPAKDQAMVVYCVSGHRASIVTMALQMLGYTNVKNLGGGINAWKAAELPVVGVVDWTAEWTAFTSGLPSDMYTIAPADLNGLLAEKAPFVLDVREAAEFEKGFVAGSVNIPVRDVLKNLDKLPALDQPIVVTCASGHRGALALAALRMLGYTDVKNLAGGIKAWEKAELPLVTEPVTAPVAGTAPAVDATKLRDLDAFLSALPEGFLAMAAADLNTELGATPAPYILDVRRAEELAETGALTADVINVPVTELFAGMDKLPADKAAPIVVMCKSGHRAAIALMALRMTGYTNVRNLAGGMNAWLAAQLPVVK